MSEKGSTAVKVFFEELKEVRRFSCNKEIPYDKFLTIVASLFPYQFANGTVNLKYEDEEKDLIVMSSELELHEAFRVAAQTNSSLRVFLSWIKGQIQSLPIEQPSVEITNEIKECLIEDKEIPRHPERQESKPMEIVKDVKSEGNAWTFTPPKALSLREIQEEELLLKQIAEEYAEPEKAKMPVIDDTSNYNDWLVVKKKKPKYQKQLKQLAEMGFNDVRRNVLILAKNRGDLLQTLQELFK